LIASFVRRPVAVSVVYVAVALLGVGAWRALPIELLPEMGFPRLSVVLSWPGASPETIEAYATSPIEGAIQQIRGVEELISTSREGSALIEVRFNGDTRMDVTRIELAERIANLKPTLPAGVRTITVSQWVPPELQFQAQRPFLSYSLSGPYLLEALQHHLTSVISPEILRIPGVSEISIEGGRNRLLEVELIPDVIAALGLSPLDVRQAITNLDIVRDAGSIRTGEREWTLAVRARPASTLEFRNAILPLRGGQVGQNNVPVLARLDDVATVRDTFEEPQDYLRTNGLPTLRFTVVKAAGVNSVRLAEVVRARMIELQRDLPEGASLVLVDDPSAEIKRAINDLRNRAGVAAGVIYLVLFLFLRSFRSAGMVFATLGLSVLISLIPIYHRGLSLNLMTLMGLALGFGLIVDNAIVVMENVFRRWEEGDPPSQAAERGAREVILPILASTATTLMVLVPFVYLRGELRALYTPMALVVGLTLLVSILVAFSLIPALAPSLLRANQVSAWDGAGYAGPRRPRSVQRGAGFLQSTLRFPWITVGVAAATVWGSWLLFDERVTRGTLFGNGWGTDRSWIQISIAMPRGSDLERVDELARSFEERVARMPEVERFTTSVRPEGAQIILRFPEELERTATPLVIEQALRAEAATFAGAEVRIIGEGPSFGGVGGGSSAPNYVVTFLGYNYARLAQIAEEFGARMALSGRVRELNTNASAGSLRERATEFVASIDRDAAARLGLTVREASELVHSSLRGTGAQGYVMLGEEPVRYEVKLAGFRDVDVQGVLDAVVTTSSGSRVRIGAFTHIEARGVLTQIRRESQQYERSVAYEFLGPRRLGDLVRDEEIANTVLPPGYHIRERTPGWVSTEDLAQLRFVFLISLALIFMVLSALLESVRQPLYILLAVPMALSGVFLIFVWTGASFTREAYLGVVLLGGIVVNNAVLLVDQINRVRRESGLGLEDAILLATLQRVRPIAMTTATTVFGLLPLVLFTKAVDSTFWNALAYVLIGGLMSSTLLVLTVIPSLYLIFERIGSRRTSKAVWGRGTKDRVTGAP
jgi:HAE1 family hydrophobic/amphiphilic exporter-1